jgi:hypothetical protein
MLAPHRPLFVLLSRMLVEDGWLSFRAFHLPVTPDQVVGGAVVLKLGSSWAFELRDNRLLQCLAQLNTP